MIAVQIAVCVGLVVGAGGWLHFGTINLSVREELRKPDVPSEVYDGLEELSSSITGAISMYVIFVHLGLLILFGGWHEDQRLIWPILAGVAALDTLGWVMGRNVHKQWIEWLELASPRRWRLSSTENSDRRL